MQYSIDYGLCLRLRDEVEIGLCLRLGFGPKILKTALTAGFSNSKVHIEQTALRNYSGTGSPWHFRSLTYFKPGASIWFEIWGVVDPGQKHFDFLKKNPIFSGNFTKKNQIFRANFPKKSIFSSTSTKNFDFSKKISEGFRFFRQFLQKFQFSRNISDPPTPGLTSMLQTRL